MSSVLSELSNDLANLVKAADPSVVRVEARRRLPATGIVWSTDGLIVTSSHVIERDKDIRIGLSDGSSVGATLVGRDPSTDIAILRAEGAQPTVPTWGSLDDLNVGNLVLALGRPGEHVMATLGVVSALEHNFQMYGGMPDVPPPPPPLRMRPHRHRPPFPPMFRGGAQLEVYLQTDVVMYPGFSGGPLVGADGKVLGMNSSTLMPGISLTLSVATLKRVAESLVKHGRIRRGFLGVGVQTVELPAAVANGVGQKHGVLVVSVEPDSPAEAAGIILGDTLIHLDGQPVREVDELLSLLMGDKVGRQVTIKLLRAGKVQEVSVTIGERV